MSFEEEYSDMQKRSWSESVENVNFCIVSDRKKHVSSHSKANCEYWKKHNHGMCPYCFNHIPIKEDMKDD